MNKKLHITLLGMFKVTYQGNVISDVNTLRLQELLAWLLLHRDIPQTRQRLSFVFWPDSRESQARNNLRNLLHLLRKALPDFEEFIIVDHISLKWNQDSSFLFDVAEFEKAITVAKRSKDFSVRETKLAEAVALYKGQLFPDSYTEWVEDHRDQVKVDYQYALEKLVELSLNNRNYDKGIRYAKMWIKDDPFSESAWRYLIKFYALNNDRANSLKTYKKCADILQKELHVKPAPETEALYEQLINDSKKADIFGDTIPGNKELLQKKSNGVVSNILSRKNQEATETSRPSDNTLDRQQDSEDLFQPKKTPENTQNKNNAGSWFNRVQHLLTNSPKYLHVFSGLILAVFFLQFFLLQFAFGDDAPGKMTIGVLPFDNLSAEHTDNALSLGMVDILSNNLAQSDEFRVISHKSVSFFKNKYTQIQMVEELSLDFLIEGSVQTFDDQVQINIQLIDAKTNEYIWTKTYEKYLGDIFFLQKELTEDILAKVNAVLGHDVKPELAISTERVNPDALKYFMKAMSIQGIPDDDNLILLQQSIAIDSTFSPAHAHLAIVYAFKFAFTHAENYRLKSQQAIDKALDLNPNSSLVYLAMAMLSEFSFEWDNAEKAFQKTIEFNPLNDIAYHELAQLQMRLGRFEEAIESEKRAIYLAPTSFQYQNGLGEIYLYQRDYEKAILEMNKALQLNADYPACHAWLAIVYMYKQDYQKALEHYDTYTKLHDNFVYPSNILAGSAQIYGYMGQKQKALDLIDTLLENNPVDTINKSLMVQLALAYTSISDVENALKWLEIGQKANAGWLIYMKVEPGFDLIRDNPRYKAVERHIFGKYSNL